MRFCLHISFVAVFALLLWGCGSKVAPCNPKLVPALTTNMPVASGDSLKLSVSGVSDVVMYNWYGPNGFTSHDSAVAIAQVSGFNSGLYHVDLVTKSGCIYSAVTDSLVISDPVLPCSMAANTGSIVGAASMTFYSYSVNGEASGGSWFLKAIAYSGDAQLEFFGTARPAAGVYTISSYSDYWGAGRVRVQLTALSSYWYGSNGKVYVSVKNGKIAVTSCSLNLSSSTYNYNTTGRFQLTEY